MSTNISNRRIIMTQALASGGGGGGAVAVVDIGTKKYQSTASSFSNSTLITVGAANALVVTVAFGSAVSGVSATWNGTSMTALASQTSSIGQVRTAYVFGLRNPTAGAQTFALSWTGATEIFVDAISFSGVNVASDGTAFPHTAVQDAGIGLTVSITSAVGNYVVGSEIPEVAGSTLTGTTLFYDNSSGSVINAGANYDIGAATVNIGMATGTNATIIAAVDVAH